MHQVLQSSTVHPQYPFARHMPYLKLACHSYPCLLVPNMMPGSSRPSDMLAHLGRLSGGLKAAWRQRQLRSKPCSTPPHVSRGHLARRRCCWRTLLAASDAKICPNLFHLRQSRMYVQYIPTSHVICAEASCRVAEASLLRLQDSWFKAMIFVHVGIH